MTPALKLGPGVTMRSTEGSRAVGLALTAFLESLDGLIAVMDGVWLVWSAALVALMSDFERVRNRLSVVDHGLLGRGPARGCIVDR